MNTERRIELLEQSLRVVVAKLDAALIAIRATLPLHGAKAAVALSAISNVDDLLRAQMRAAGRDEEYQDMVIADLASIRDDLLAALQ